MITDFFNTLAYAIGWAVIIVAAASIVVLTGAFMLMSVTGC